MVVSKVAARRRPPKTQEAEDDEMIALATSLAKKQMMEGTATSQVITHYLKLGKEKLEMQKTEREIALLDAKREAIQREEKSEEFYMKVLTAMKKYSGDLNDDEYYIEE